MVRDQRIFTRVPFIHPVQWTNEQGDGGTATVRDFSRSGLSLELGRYLRPGPVLRLVFDGIGYDGHPVQLDAETVWSKADPSTPERFVAGFAVLHDHAHTLGAVSEVFYAALRQNAEQRPA